MAQTLFSIDLQSQVLSRKIKEQAQAEGFDKVGIVRAEALQPERERLREWLGRRFHGEVQWVGRRPHKRAEPRGVFSQTQSGIVVSPKYYTHPTSSNKAGTSKN